MVLSFVCFEWHDIIHALISNLSSLISRMPSFSQLKDMYRMQQEAKRVRKELSKIHIEAESNGVKVVVTAEQEVVSITIADDVPREAIAERTKDATNRGMKKAQLIASERMQGIMKEMGMPGAEAQQ